MKDNTITIRIEPEIRVIDKKIKGKQYKCCSEDCPFMSYQCSCRLFNTKELAVVKTHMLLDLSWYYIRCGECIAAEEEYNERDIEHYDNNEGYSEW